MSIKGFKINNQIEKYDYGYLDNIPLNIDSIASEYSPSSPYDVGDYVIHNGQLYRCIYAINTAEAWTSSHWKDVVLTEDFIDLLNRDNKITEGIENLLLTEAYNDWSLGAISIVDGTTAVDNSRIKTTSFTPITPNLHVSASTGANVGLRFYSSASTSAYIWYADFFTDDTRVADIAPELATHVRFVARYSDDATVSDVNALADLISVRELGTANYKRIYPSWSVGNLNATTHRLTNDTNRIHTDYIQVNDGIKIFVDSGYKYAVHYFDINGSPLMQAYWNTGHKIIYPDQAELVRITAAVEEDDNGSIMEPNNFGLHVSIERNGDGEEFELRFNATPNAPDLNPTQLLPEYMVLEYVREQHRQNEMDRTVGYLYRTASSPYKFYYADGKPENLKYLFTWDTSVANDGNATPIRYAFAMTAEGDVVCVWRGEIATSDYTDAPIVYPHDDYAHPVRVALPDVKPTAWLGNVGVFCEDATMYFGEYTRTVNTAAHVWKVETPYKNAENWSVIKTYTLDPTPEDISSLVPGNIEHIHHVTRDPFSGVLYVTTGDHGTEARIDYFDENEEWHSLLAGNERLCRQLNFIFTPKYVYWAADAWRYWDYNLSEWVSNQHNFFRAVRDEDGLIDLDNVEIFNIPDLASSIVTYNVCYINDAILILDRHDVGANYYEIPIRVFDCRTSTLKLIGLVTQAAGDDLMLGFRTECCQHYPNLYDDKMQIGFALYPNTINVCGNPAPDVTSAGWTKYDSTNLAQVNNMSIEVTR